MYVQPVILQVLKSKNYIICYFKSLFTPNRSSHCSLPDLYCYYVLAALTLDCNFQLEHVASIQLQKQTLLLRDHMRQANPSLLVFRRGFWYWAVATRRRRCAGEQGSEGRVGSEGGRGMKQEPLSLLWRQRQMEVEE
jgi:hypothetical protein